MADVEKLTVDGTTYELRDAKAIPASNIATNWTSPTTSTVPNTNLVDSRLKVDETNILYALKMGAKNLIKFDNNIQKDGLTIVQQEDGSIKIDGTATGGSGLAYIRLGYFTYEANTTYNILSESINNLYYFTEDNKLNSNNGGSATYTAGGTTKVILCLAFGVEFHIVLYPMICEKAVWDALGGTYQPPSLPNSDLTYLEAEDRAALAEVVDSGAKNLVDLVDKTMTISGYAYDKTTIPTLPKGTYACSIAKTNTVASMQVALWDSNNNEVGRFNPDDNYFTTTGAATKITIWVNLVGGSSSGTISNIMICTNAAFGVSQKFVPYRPDWDTVAKRLTNPIKAGTWVKTYTVPMSGYGKLHRITILGGDPTYIGEWIIMANVISEVVHHNNVTYTVNAGSNIVFTMNVTCLVYDEIIDFY